MSPRHSSTTQVRRAYEQFLTDGTSPDGVVRSLVRDSWARSAQRGVASTGEPTGGTLSDADFADYRATHPLTAVRPLINELLLEDVADAGVVVAVTDHRGRLLWVDGDRTMRRRAASINFVEGSLWSEESVGTNAPGLALNLDQGVQILGPEHYASAVQKWNCTAAPVHNQHTGELLGAIDVTGGPVAAAPFALTAVRSVVAAVERELLARAVDLAPTVGTTSPQVSAAPRLSALSTTPQWQDATGRAVPLSPRHAEIALLLHLHPAGLTTAQLAALLSESDRGQVTIRAEVSRLRRDLGSALSSRPYRLSPNVTSDVAEVRAAIATRSPLRAVTLLGSGGLLATSSAPGLVDAFDVLREDVRSAVFASGDTTALREWAASPHGVDDLQAWDVLRRTLPSDDPDAAKAAGRVRLLNRRFGT